MEYAGIFYVLKKDNSISSKLGVAAGKKLGNAVVRNRMKRLMREVYRNLQFDIEKGFEIIWIARRPLLNANIDFYKKTFLKFAKRAGILAKKEG